MFGYATDLAPVVCLSVFHDVRLCSMLKNTSASHKASTAVWSLPSVCSSLHHLSCIVHQHFALVPATQVGVAACLLSWQASHWCESYNTFECDALETCAGGQHDCLCCDNHSISPSDTCIAPVGVSRGRQPVDCEAFERCCNVMHCSSALAFLVE